MAQAGGKKMSGIAKAAAIAQLAIDLATKPFEAYAKTSAAFPFPLGPALGAVCMPGWSRRRLGLGMANVGGSGGGSSFSAGGVTSGNVVSPLDEELQREQEPRVIELTVNLDGQPIAQKVQEILAHAEDE